MFHTPKGKTLRQGVASATAFVSSKLGLSPTAKSEQASQMDATIYNTRSCLKCDELDTDDMVVCDGCGSEERWFHFTCVGLSPDEVKGLDNYFCDECKAREAAKPKDPTSPKGACEGGCTICNKSAPAVPEVVSCALCSDRVHLTCLGLSLSQIVAWKDLCDLRLFEYKCPSCTQIPKNLPKSVANGEATTTHKPVRIVKGRWDPLSNFYMHDLPLDDDIFKAGEFALQILRSRRFRKQALERRIAAAETALQAKHLSRSISQFCCREEDAVIMERILEAKRDSCRAFRDALRESGDQHIVHSTYANVDLFWGSGLHYKNTKDAAAGRFPGQNVLGQLLMKIRSTLKEESAYPVEEVQVAAYGDNTVVVFNKGDDLSFLSDGKKGGKYVGGRGNGKLGNGRPPPVKNKTGAASRGVGHPNKHVFPVTRERRPLLNKSVNFDRNVFSNSSNYCFYCGEPGHVAKVCRFGKKAKCYKCGCLGHKQKWCHFYNVSGSTGYNGGIPGGPMPTHSVFGVNRMAPMHGPFQANIPAQNMQRHVASVVSGPGGGGFWNNY